ncbi:MAG: hypothetical protein QNJ13_17720 [Paracoccaceae bacterium]|nr:hypothetical protein [Paracoccaceae bacterium]
MTPETVKRNGIAFAIYRDAPQWKGRTAAIGRFRCTDASAGAAALAATCETLRAEGFDSVVGPMDGSTWHTYRLILDSDGSPPFLMEPRSGPQDLAAFEDAGFSVVERYFSARTSLADHQGALPAPSPDLRIEVWDGSEPERFFRDVHALSLEAFAGNVLYKPIGAEEFLEMYLPFVPMLVPDLILFARGAGDRLAGFLFGLPNYAEGNAPTSVILKTYASLQKGAGATLAHQFHVTARRLGFHNAIHALIHEDNLSATRSRQNAAEVIRRYGLMGRRLG